MKLALSLLAAAVLAFGSTEAHAVIFIDQPVTHSSSGTGDDTVPPGVTGLTWCHVVSTVSAAELLGWLVANVLTVGANPLDMRTPLLGSLQTYIGLDPALCVLAAANGAIPNRTVTVRVSGFDSPGGGTGPWYEP